MIHCFLFFLGSGVWTQFIFEVKFLNFGNYFIALTNGLHAAQLSGNSCVVIKDKHAAFELVPPVVCYRNGKYDADQRTLGTNDSRPVIRAAYFYSDIARHFASSCPSWQRRSEIFSAFSDNVYQSLNSTRTDIPSEILEDPKTLVVHLRSGDIFSYYKLEFYWQPPLGYYQISSKGYERLVIVSQTGNNPVIQSFYTYCVATRGEENCFLKIDRHLKEDLHILLRAESLCVGYGSFGFAAAAISKKLKTLIFPFTMMDFSPGASVGIDTISVRGYPLSKTVMISFDRRLSHRHENWAGTPEQLELLQIDENRLENVSLTYMYARGFHLKE